MNSRSQRLAIRGFTLTELMVTIAIVAILMSIGVPSYQYVTNANRIASEVNGLLGDLQFARAEAIKEGLTVTICVGSTDASNNASCTANSTAWQTGWVVFSDPTGAAAGGNGFLALRQQKPFTGTDTFAASNNVGAVTFNREGFASGAGIANGALIKLHDATSNSKWTRCLSITRVGLMATQTYNMTLNGFTCT
jgi:type IV fimbrial biogenesis protein FimT